MSKKKIALIAVGGTGGHVFPGCNLAKHLNDSGYNVKLATDRRGYKYLENYKDLNISILPSSPFIYKNIFTIFFSLISITYSILYSLKFLILTKPAIIFGMGGYASFPICIAASILRIKFIIYENNLVIGRANKYLSSFAKKIFVAFEEIEGISKKNKNKMVKIGNILKKEIINFQVNAQNFENQKNLNILVLGGSQAAKIFAETLPDIFKKCSQSGIALKIYQHCLPKQNKQLELFYKTSNIDFEIFNFSNNLINYFLKSNLAITRSGSSVLAELTNVNIPFISVPLPSSTDNHQYKNAVFYEQKNFSKLIEEKDLNDKLYYLIKEIYENNSILDKIRQNQRQFSDKNVYNNINQELDSIIDEKN